MVGEPVWESWFENQWWVYGWQHCDACDMRATWIKWNRATGDVQRACDHHHQRGLLAAAAISSTRDQSSVTGGS